ncbi:MAG: glycosyltransferase family A protein [Candidatus Dormibacteria bacterium]
MTVPLRVSVCVPAYGRPGTVAQLIHSFRRQDIPSAELCVSDDSPSDSVERVVAAECSGLQVMYAHNSSPIGFAANLWKAMSMASGDVLVVLGDDDLLVDVSALSLYADALARNPSAHYCYSGLLQVDDDLTVTLAYPARLPRDGAERLLSAGDDALKGAWFSSIVITGLGFRRSGLLSRYYPQRQFSPGVDRLYPQVELVGRLCLEHDVVVLGRYLCGFRAHSGQLGFEAAKGSVGDRRSAHGLDELPLIAQKLAALYPRTGSCAPKVCALELSRQYRTNLVNECLAVGVGPTRRKVVSYVRAQAGQPGRLALLLTVGIVSVLPKRAVRVLKRAARGVVAQRRLARAGVDRSAVRKFLGEVRPE